MLNSGNTLHFINRVDDSNCGDRMVCPLLYYYDYFKQYQIRRHDMRFIDFENIASSDVVIIGGGGMFDYAEFTNRNINKVLDTGAAVIAWSPGFNTHTEYSGTFTTPIDFNRFAAVTVRDFSNSYGLEYLPDVTCKLPGLREKYSLRRKYGIARHKDYPIKGFDYDTIANNRGIDEILQFIGESEIVISDSFHMIYWSILMGKKTLCVNPFSSKFYSYKYKPTYLDTNSDNLSDCIDRAQTYYILDECIEANDAFFERVKAIIENNLQPISDQWTLYDLVTQEALLTEKIRENQPQKGDLLASQLFIDAGQGITEDCKLIAINNVQGDEVHSVRYNLSNFHNIKALRFDPIESHNCEVEIISAKTANGDAVLAAQASVRVGSWDRFLSTDPQYYITSHCEEFLEITFRLKILSRFDAERNFYFYVEQQNSKIKQQAVLSRQQISMIEQQASRLQQQDAQAEQQIFHIQQQNTQMEQQASQIQQQNAQIEQQSLSIQQQKAQIKRQAAAIHYHATQVAQLLNSNSWKITAPIRAIADFTKRLLKGTKYNDTDGQS